MSILELVQAAFSHFQRDQLAEAWDLCEKVLIRQPDNAEILHLSGCIANRQNRPREGVKRIERAIRRAGPNPNFAVNYGNALAALDRLAEAEAAYLQAIRLDPRFAAAYNNLGNLMLRQEREEDAIRAFDRALVCQPSHPNALPALARLMFKRKLYDPALTLMSRAVEGNPKDETILNELADYCVLACRSEVALTYLDRFVRGAPASAIVRTNAGRANLLLRRFHAALEHYREAHRLDPANGTARSGLVEALARIGQMADAIDTARRFVASYPADSGMHSQLLFLLLHHPNASPREIYAEHQRWNDHHAAHFENSDPSSTNTGPEIGRLLDRKLRVGYVSPDFRKHSVAYFVEPVFARHDRSRFEVHCYYNHSESDEYTKRIESAADRWVNCSAMDDDTFCRHVREDGIDILVDLSGHTARNRLLAFARRPAAIQVAWLGYPFSTGLSAMDYRITDAYAEPPGQTEHFNRERLWRLPGAFCCYSVPGTSPHAATCPPLDSNGHITFGCFNSFLKVSDPTLAAWAAIMKRVPNSRLLLEVLGIEEPVLKNEILERLRAAGLPADRLDLEPRTPTNQFTLYNRVDISLDPFPLSGGTTSLDALWMGVPLVTLAGDHFGSRLGVSFLSQLDLADLVAESVDRYVDLAVQLASDRGRLQSLRRDLRRRMECSPLMDAEAFTRNLEAAFSQMWSTRHDRAGARRS